MAPAADAMAEALERDPPRPPVRAAGRQCVGRRGTRSGAIRDLLVEQVTGDGALAGMRAAMAASGWTASSNSAPARCCPA